MKDENGSRMGGQRKTGRETTRGRRDSESQKSLTGSLLLKFLTPRKYL